MHYIKFFKTLSPQDDTSVGGKNASLGRMLQNLSARGILVPDGFALTVDAYWEHLNSNNLVEPITRLLKNITENNLDILQQSSATIQKLIVDGTLPQNIQVEIAQAYQQLSKQYHSDAIAVAVRSSATAEDSPQASFAGQQETYLNVVGLNALINAVKQCMASLFTSRAIIYRREQGFEDLNVGISVGIQKMVQAETAGVVFTLDPETGFPDVITINASYGLGETIVKGIVTPDEFMVHKPTLQQGYASIIKKTLGSKTSKLIYGNDNSSTILSEVSQELQHSFCLIDDEIIQLARQALIIEDYYSGLHGKWIPMDIEWAQELGTRQLYIVQARPETVQSQKNSQQFISYKLDKIPRSDQILVTGSSIGQKIVAGVARRISHVKDAKNFNDGDIIITEMTDPDWVPLLKRAGGIVTGLGGRTCHAAIVARELGIPAIVGAKNATTTIQEGQKITLDASQGSQGIVYNDILAFSKTILKLDTLQEHSVEVMVNLANPDRAFEVAQLPVAGVGLARLEFIINTMIGIHPMAIAMAETIKDVTLLQQMKILAPGYPTLKDFFINVLAQAIGMIAAAFFPRPIIVRLTDFKSNEYKDLLGGELFEPNEENPMLGFRGAVRYCSNGYEPAFALECAAIKKAREEMGFDNIIVMVPFVRTVQEAAATLKALAHHGLVRHKNNLKIFMMVEVPSNVLLFDDFAPLFDGFSIGSNDLTQLTLGVDRDSGLLTHLFDERDLAVKKMFSMVIAQAKKHNKYIGICGQAPSDFPELADFLIREGIKSLSLNPDSVISFLMRK